VSVKGPDDVRLKEKGGEKNREENNQGQPETAAAMNRSIRPYRVFDEAIPIAQARGLIQKAMSGPEQIFDIAIVSKVPYVFARVMFAPEILAPVIELAEYYKKEIARLRLIVRAIASSAELWIRSKHGSWRFFLVTPDSLVEIDREGNLLGTGTKSG